VGTNGTGFRVVLTPANSPAGLPDTGELHQPAHAPDGRRAKTKGTKGLPSPCRFGGCNPYTEKEITV